MPSNANQEEIQEQVVDICPMCREKTLELVEKEMEIPYFGKALLFSMTCSSCKYHISDVEAVEQREPGRFTFEIQDERDLNVRIVKSSEATVKIPHITAIEPGPAAQGYVSNIEGLLNRVKHQIEVVRETAEDDEDRAKAKNLLKKLFKIKSGQEKQKIIIEDPSGNSAIISDRAVKEKLKVRN